MKPGGGSCLALMRAVVGRSRRRKPAAVSDSSGLDDPGGGAIQHSGGGCMFGKIATKRVDGTGSRFVVQPFERPAEDSQDEAKCVIDVATEVHRRLHSRQVDVRKAGGPEDLPYGIDLLEANVPDGDIAGAPTCEVDHPRREVNPQGRSRHRRASSSASRLTCPAPNVKDTIGAPQLCRTEKCVVVVDAADGVDEVCIVVLTKARSGNSMRK
jgi:hypothetical protein